MPLFELFVGTPDGVFAVDRGQRIVFWNDGARRILGFEADAVLGRSCYDVLGGTDESGGNACKCNCATFRASLRAELCPTRDAQVHAGDGGRKWINISTLLIPSRDRELTLLAHVFRDSSHAGRLSSRLSRSRGGAVRRGELDRLPHPLAPLTKSEATVLRLLACGVTTQTICSRLGVKTTTVRTHVQHIIEKLGVHTRIEAVASGAQNGLLGHPTD